MNPLAASPKIAKVEFDIEQFYAATMLSDELLQNCDPSQLKVELRYMATRSAHALTALLKLPGKRLPPRVVCSYPTTWWDHLKASFGWSHNRTKVLREDVVVLPDLKLPEHLMRNARVVVRYVEEFMPNAAD